MVKEAWDRLNGHKKQVQMGLVFCVAAFLAQDVYRDIKSKADQVPPLITKVKENNEAIIDKISTNRLVSEGEWSNQRVHNDRAWEMMTEQRAILLEILKETRKTHP